MLSWLLKEERVAECLISWWRLFQMWGPKCENERKPWVLRLKRCSLSMRVSVTSLILPRAHELPEQGDGAELF